MLVIDPAVLLGHLEQGPHRPHGAFAGVPSFPTGRAIRGPKDMGLLKNADIEGCDLVQRRWSQLVASAAPDRGVCRLLTWRTCVYRTDLELIEGGHGPTACFVDSTIEHLGQSGDVGANPPRGNEHGVDEPDASGGMGYEDHAVAGLDSQHHPAACG